MAQQDERDVPGPSGLSPRERHERGDDRSGAYYVLRETPDNARVENQRSRRLFGTDRKDIELPKERKRGEPKRKGRRKKRSSKRR